MEKFLLGRHLLGGWKMKIHMMSLVICYLFLL